MGTLYTSGRWTVAPGREDEFVAAWRDLAEWTAGSVKGAGHAVLMQSSEQPNVFLSFGPWESAEAIEAWRASDGFRERVGRIRELLEGFEPGVYEARVEVGGP